MQVGDLVVCKPQNKSVWYWGKPGLLVYYDHWGKKSTTKGDPVVQYGNRQVRLAGSTLEVINEGR